MSSPRSDLLLAFPEMFPGPPREFAIKESMPDRAA
jgi:hypothetical protein